MLYPHCTYIGDAPLNSWSSYDILWVDYVAPDGVNYSLTPSGTGTVEEARAFLDTNLSAYHAWSFSGWTAPSVELSTNQILFMTVDVDGDDQVIVFGQSACVELPLQSEAVSGTGSTDFFDADNLFEINLVEVWISGLILIFLTIFLIFTKGIPWAK